MTQRSVETMPQVITVEITRADIDKGRRSNCPVFHALERNGWDVLSVESVEVEVIGKDDLGWFYTPSDEAMHWIERYDLGIVMQPGSFTMERDDSKNL